MAQQIQQTSLPGPKTVGEAISDFSMDLYKLIANSMATNDNLFMSPYSVSAALMLTMLGTGGNSERQLMTALKLIGLPTKNVHSEYKTLHEFLNSKPGSTVTLSIANRIFAKLGLNISASYKSDSLNFYGSELELLDFVTKAEESRVHINSWIEKQTNNKIKDLLPAGSIGPLSLIVLTNAIYFKGDWARQFKPERTRKTKFHVSSNANDDVDVEMMSMSKEEWMAGIHDDLGCKVLEMPYKGEELSMVLILPNEIDGLSKLEQKLTMENLNSLMSCVRNQDTIVSIPKFKMEAKFELQKLLPNLGILDIFDADSADFSKMFETSPGKAYVSDVIHKAFIEVNEEGTEAAAATAVMMRLMCMPMDPLKFIADHPFLFMIKENKTKTILFIGRYCKPS